MADYKRMYLLLFNAGTDALRLLRQGQSGAAAEMLMAAQRKAEELYMQEGEGATWLTFPPEGRSALSGGE